MEHRVKRAHGLKLKFPSIFFSSVRFERLSLRDSSNFTRKILEHLSLRARASFKPGWRYYFKELLFF